MMLIGHILKTVFSASIEEKVQMQSYIVRSNGRYCTWWSSNIQLKEQTLTSVAGQPGLLFGHEFLPHYERCDRRPPLFDGISYSHVGFRGKDVLLWWGCDEDGRWARRGLCWLGFRVGICGSCDRRGQNVCQVLKGEETHWLTPIISHLKVIIMYLIARVIIAQNPLNSLFLVDEPHKHIKGVLLSRSHLLCLLFYVL